MLPLLEQPCNPCGHYVDMVRSCYSADWILPGGGGTVTRGRYIFADPDATPYPDFHWWGSRHWADDQDVGENPDFGQDRQGDETWSDGGGAIDAPPPSLAGTGSCCIVPCLAGKPACDPSVRVPEFITVRFVYRGFNWQQCYARIQGPIHNGSEEWLRIGVAPPLIHDCNPAPVIGKVAFSLPDSIVLFCTDINLPSRSPWLLFPAFSSVNGVNRDIPGWTTGEYGPPRLFPLGKIFSDGTNVPLDCLTGTVNGVIQWAMFGSMTEFPAGSIPPNNPDAFYNGFPIQCWPTPPGPVSAPWPFSPFDDDWTLEAVEILCKQYLSPAAGEAQLQAIVGPDYAISRVDNSNAVVPGSMVAKGPGRSVVIVSGTTTHAQLAWQALTLLAPPTNFGTHRTAPVWQSSATSILARMTVAGVAPSDELIVVGHSYGAAVALLIAYRLAIVNPRQKIGLLLFAAPPIGFLGVNNVLPANVVARSILNVGDPIGLAPPPDNLILQCVNLLPGPPPVVAWEQWRHPVLRTRLLSDGTLVPGNEPTVGIVELGQMLALAMVGGPPAIPNPHRTPAYVRRLTLPDAPITICGTP